MSDARVLADTGYVLCNPKGLGGSPVWFRDWTGIGPRMTDELGLAFVFETEKDALLESSMHYCFVGYEPVKVEKAQRKVFKEAQG